MRPSLIITCVEDIILANKESVDLPVSIFLHGPPGVGKTAAIEEACRRAAVALWPFPPTVSLDPVDVRGLKSRTEKGKDFWAIPHLWPDPDFTGVIFIDELPQGTGAVQATLMQPIQSRKLGDIPIPQRATFIACGNRQQDRAGVNKVLTPLLNRFLHLDLEVSWEDWNAWALEAKVESSVRSFIAFKPDLLHKFDPKLDERSFASPRSWHNVARVIPKLRPETMHACVAGLVGDGPAAELIAFRQIYEQLPDPDLMLADPKNCKLPDGSKASGGAIYYALTGALVERLRDKTDAGIAEKFVTLTGRFPREFSVLSMRDAKRVLPAVTSGPVGQKWLRENRDILL